MNNNNERTIRQLVALVNTGVITIKETKFFNADNDISSKYVVSVDGFEITEFDTIFSDAVMFATQDVWSEVFRLRKKRVNTSRRKAANDDDEIIQLELP